MLFPHACSLLAGWMWLRQGSSLSQMMVRACMMHNVSLLCISRQVPCHSWAHQELSRAACLYAWGVAVVHKIWSETMC